MKTAVVILNWNGKKFLEMFIPGVLRSLGPEARLIVADNASTDGSVELLREKFPDVPVMLFSRNRGFTGGYNRALMELDAEYFLLLNSDIDVPEHWLEPLEEWMDSHPECGICAPKLHSYAEREKFEYAGAAGGYVDRFGYPYCRGRVMKYLEEAELSVFNALYGAVNTEYAACGPEAVFDEPYYREVYDRATGRPVGQEAALAAGRPPAGGPAGNNDGQAGNVGVVDDPGYRTADALGQSHGHDGFRVLPRPHWVPPGAGDAAAVAPDPGGASGGK